MTIRLAFLGDTLLGGTGQPAIDEHGYDYPMSGIRHLWAGADLVVANHEGPLTKSVTPGLKADTGRKRFWYKGTPESAFELARSGIGAVSLANNHVCDFGYDGLDDTIAALDAAGVRHCGAGRNDVEARRPLIVDVKGLRVGFLSVMQRYAVYLREPMYADATTPGAALLDPETIGADIAALREQVDVCVVLVHWGRNYKDLQTGQRELAGVMTAAGADLVVGHHPHIPHQVREVNGVPVLFSLGNGVFGSPGRFHSGRPPFGLIALVDVDVHAVTSVRLVPIHVDNAEVNYRPVPAPAEVAAAYA